jgi:hypothetical protein
MSLALQSFIRRNEMLENYFGYIIAASAFLTLWGLLFTTGSQAQSQTKALGEQTKSVTATASHSLAQRKALQPKTVSPSNANSERIDKLTRELMAMILNNKAVFDRLVKLEMKLDPRLNYADAIQEAIDRLRKDINRY